MILFLVKQNTQLREKVDMAGAKMVALVNGTHEFEPVVQGVYLSLIQFKENHPTAFREFVNRCRGRVSHVSGETQMLLQEYVMLYVNDFDATLCNIVTSAVVGEGDAIKINNPIREEAR